jgi:tetratricopeptide (TPR) repeat protein
LSRHAALSLVLLLTAAHAAAQEANPSPEPPRDPARISRMRDYHEALRARRLSGTTELGKDQVETTLREAEEAIGIGRAPEATARLLQLTADPRFAVYETTELGIAARFLLGDAYADLRAHDVARAHLRLVIENPNTWKPDGASSAYARRAVRRLVEIAILDSRAARLDLGLADLKSVPTTAPADVRSELAYLEGRAKEQAKDPAAALTAYGRVTQASRHWAQATYLAGLIHVEQGRPKEGEDLFCKIADPKRTGKTTPIMADERFFAVRDLARLALGRVAHEGLRHDDARYYYYLVPRDSDRLAEALYESATTRYEKKDYDGARELLDQLFALDVHHGYEDEARILDAYVDLGRCKFPDADKKLRAFIARYEPLLRSVRTLAQSERGLRAILASTDVSKADAASLSTSENDVRTIASLVRVDPTGLLMARRVATLEQSLGGLTQTETELGALEDMVSGGARGLRPASDQSVRAMPSLATPELSQEERARETKEALDGLRRAIDDAETHDRERAAPLRVEYEALVRSFEARAKVTPSAEAAPDGKDLLALVLADRAELKKLRGELEAVHREVVDAQVVIARDGMQRLDMRLSRLLRRARLGRIESVLGKKRALEVEVEAIAAGYLPKDAVDSLRPARYLKDNEEYWPFEGDDWPDEFVGKER